MSRLTEKRMLNNLRKMREKNPDYICSNEELMYDKLGRLEDLEDELGCPLEVLSEISKNGFYEHYGYIPPYHISRIDIFKREIMYYDEETNYFTVKLKDYKKTWWLKEDRSE